MRRRLVHVIALTAALFGLTAAPAAALPQIKHVFIVVLENENAESTFGPNSAAPYLSKTLKRQGAFIPNYYATAHNSLPNYIGMVSGQGPTIENQADCQLYHDILPGLVDSSGQSVGTGCVYPPGVETIANQLEGEGYTWKGYMEDMAAKAPAEPATCRHPDLNSLDDTQSAEVGDQYAARHNPFVYFHSITDLATCDKNDVDLSRMAKDLKSKGTTPNYAFIVPNLCNDGHDAPCVDGKPGGLTSANLWLEKYVPGILASPGFRDHGLLMVTFDEAEGSGDDADSTACCNEQPGPNTPSPGALHPGPGGGRIGAVALSPCIRSGTESDTPYNHYSLLRSVEDMFGLPHLAFAAQAGLATFDKKIVNKPGCKPTKPPCGAITRGTGGNDRLVGTAIADNIFGRRGNDVLKGKAGRDCLHGGAGNDRLFGGSARDRLSGGRGNDRINAVDGSRDVVFCGTGHDRVRADKKDRVSPRCQHVRRV